jgi:septal ring factor EnvC (AmiA/AmiB activator)
VESFSGVALLLLAMVVFANYRNGTLGGWLKAKFLNRAPGPTGDWNQPAQGGDFPAASGGTGGVVRRESSPSTWLGRLIKPVNGPVTGHFGDQRIGHVHEGVDWAVPVGTAVEAAGAGTVLFAGPSAGYGLRVDVDHGNGLVTRYAHLSHLGVVVGGQVTAGQPVGQSGNTGDSTGPHLHFEVRQDGVAVDPNPYLGVVTT